MKRIIEVTQYGENDIRFKTDLDLKQNEQDIVSLIASVAMAMVTSLWGGNEASILAIIRAMAIADLTVSTNRKEMIRFLDMESKHFADIFHQSVIEMQKKGGVAVFPPGINPGKATC